MQSYVRLQNPRFKVVIALLLCAIAMTTFGCFVIFRGSMTSIRFASWSPTPQFYHRFRGLHMERIINRGSYDDYYLPYEGQFAFWKFDYWQRVRQVQHHR